MDRQLGRKYKRFCTLMRNYKNEMIDTNLKNMEQRNRWAKMIIELTKHIENNWNIPERND